MTSQTSQNLLFFMIPCWNERENLAAVLSELPRSVQGADAIRLLVVDDGSTDGTGEIAEQQGAEVVRLLAHVGLAKAYARGLKEAVLRGASWIVTLDGDGQYDPAALPRLLEPLLSSRADIVLAERSPQSLQDRSVGWRLSHRLGGWVFQRLSGLAIDDPVTGYRAYSRYAASLLEVHSSYTCSLETLFQAKALGLRILSLQADSRPPCRPSRLIKHPVQYVGWQAATMLWATGKYRLPALFSQTTRQRVN